LIHFQFVAKYVNPAVQRDKYGFEQSLPLLAVGLLLVGFVSLLIYGYFIWVVFSHYKNKKDEQENEANNAANAGQNQGMLSYR